MMRTSELKKELNWEQTYQQVLKRKAERYKAKGLIHNGDIILGIHECYDDCMNLYNNSVEREESYRAELERRKELPKMYAYKIASIVIALVTFGHITMMQ